jgi:hypothetical protein
MSQARQRRRNQKACSPSLHVCWRATDTEQPGPRGSVATSICVGTSSPFTEALSARDGGTDGLLNGSTCATTEGPVPVLGLKLPKASKGNLSAYPRTSWIIERLQACSCGEVAEIHRIDLVLATQEHCLVDDAARLGEISITLCHSIGVEAHIAARSRGIGVRRRLQRQSN